MVKYGNLTIKGIGVLFFSYNGNNIILLSYFKKMINKTPKREIEKAKKYMKDYLERSIDNE